MIREVLEGIVKNGFDEKAILSAINYFEFRYREADFGTTPKGLMYCHHRKVGLSDRIRCAEYILADSRREISVSL